MYQREGLRDQSIWYGFICPKCHQTRRIIKTVSEKEMICGTCGYHLRQGNIFFLPDKKPKHFFMHKITKIPILGR